MGNGSRWLRRRGAYGSACGRRRAAGDSARGQRRAAYDSARDDPGDARHSGPARCRVRHGRSRRRRLDRRAGHRFGGDRADCHCPQAQRPAGDVPGGLGHPDPGAADRRGRGPGCRLVRPAGVDHSAGHPVHRRAGPRRGGRAGGAPDRHRHRAGRPHRLRDRRVPHPAAQHLRGPGLRRLGAGHRRRPLRAAAGGLADPVAGRAVATPVLGQGRGRGPGHRAHRRRIRTARPPCRDDRGRRRVAAAGRVVRPQRDLAVPHRRRPAHPPGSAAGHHRAFGRARVGCSRRARPCLSVHPRRLCPHPRGGAGPGCHRAGPADLAATDRGRRRWNPVQPAHSHQDPQRSVLRADRAGVQSGLRLGQHQPGYWRGTRHDRPHAH